MGGKAEVIAFANQKGGVGKTTSCVNIAASLHALKQRVLLIDLDPQGNATMGSGINKSTLKCSTNDVLLEQASLQQALITNTPAGFDLLPANSDLTAAEVMLVKKPQREGKLAQALKAYRTQYDFILMDCPPSLNMLTLNALAAADSLIIPMQCEYYALEGLSALLSTLTKVQQSLNPHIHIKGILRTMYDPRNRLAQDVSKQLLAHFGEHVYQTVIPRNVRLAEAPSHGLPILMYDKHSRGASAYLAVAGEMIKRTHARQPKSAAAQAATLA